MRAVVGLIVLLGCGDPAVPVADPSPIVRLDLPRMDEASRVLVLEQPRPPALVWITASGGIAIGKTGASFRGDITPPAATAEVELGEVRRKVLQAIVDGGGARADEAQRAFGRLDADAAARRRQALLRRRPRGMAVTSRDPLVPAPGRLAAADLVELAKLDKLAPLVIATPSAPATTLARVLHATGGVLAVDHLGKLAAFDLAFERERQRGVAGAGSWLELHVDREGLHLTVQPDGQDTVVAWDGARLDRPALAAAYAKLDIATLPIDILVRDDTTAQTLVEVLAALAGAGLRPTAVVAGPSSVEERRLQLVAAREGRPMIPPTVSPGVLTAQGDLDKPSIQFTVGQHLTRIRGCYERVLVDDPTLTGTILVRFFITPDGTVATAAASGMDPDVASCVANVFRGLEFPKPAGGGGVQVDYPLRFRP